MRVSNKFLMSLAGVAGLVMVGSSVFAHPPGYAGMGRGGMGPWMMGGGGPCAANAEAGAQCPMFGQGYMRGGGGCVGAGPNAGWRGPGIGQSLMSDEERQASQDKMRAATTPEERQKLAAEHRAELQKRAAEQGIDLSQWRGPGMGYGMGPYRGRGGPPAPAQ